MTETCTSRPITTRNRGKDDSGLLRRSVDRIQRSPGDGVPSRSRFTVRQRKLLTLRGGDEIHLSSRTIYFTPKFRWISLLPSSYLIHYSKTMVPRRSGYRTTRTRHKRQDLPRCLSRPTVVLRTDEVVWLLWIRWTKGLDSPVPGTSWSTSSWETELNSVRDTSPRQPVGKVK